MFRDFGLTGVIWDMNLSSVERKGNCPFNGAVYLSPCGMNAPECERCGPSLMFHVHVRPSFMNLDPSTVHTGQTERKAELVSIIAVTRRYTLGPERTT